MITLSQYNTAIHVAEGLVNMNKKVTARKLETYSIFCAEGSLIGCNKKALKQIANMYKEGAPSIGQLARYKQTEFNKFMAENSLYIAETNSFHYRREHVKQI